MSLPLSLGPDRNKRSAWYTSIESASEYKQDITVPTSLELFKRSSRSIFPFRVSRSSYCALVFLIKPRIALARNLLRRPAKAFCCNSSVYCGGDQSDIPDQYGRKVSGSEFEWPSGVCCDCCQSPCCYIPPPAYCEELCCGKTTACLITPGCCCGPKCCGGFPQIFTRTQVRLRVSVFLLFSSALMFCFASSVQLFSPHMAHLYNRMGRRSIVHSRALAKILSLLKNPPREAQQKEKEEKENKSSSLNEVHVGLQCALSDDPLLNPCAYFVKVHQTVQLCFVGNRLDLFKNFFTDCLLSPVIFRPETFQKSHALISSEWRSQPIISSRPMDIRHLQSVAKPVSCFILPSRIDLAIPVIVSAMVDISLSKISLVRTLAVDSSCFPFLCFFHVILLNLDCEKISQPSRFTPFWSWRKIFFGLPWRAEPLASPPMRFDSSSCLCCSYSVVSEIGFGAVT